MRLPASLILSLMLLVFCVVLCPSQTVSTKRNASATISGKVTIKGKPAPGVVVGARSSRPAEFDPTYRATTDEEGSYRINALPAGIFDVAPVAPTLVIGDSNEGGGGHVILSEDEHVDGINFELVRGGVITGKITDAEGRPAIEENVNLLGIDLSNQRGTHVVETIRTDDRGIYRMFGIRPGQYKVSVGLEGNVYGGAARGRPARRPTFYPDATESAKATIVEIGEGTEAAKIDIVLGSVIQGYSVNGRVIDESEKPLANLSIVLSRITVIDANNTSSSSGTGGRSDNRGEFRLENLPPGKYSISVQPPPESDLRAVPVNFDVLDQDVTGLVIKTSIGASVAGVVVLEGAKDGGISANFRQAYIEAMLDHGDNTSSGRSVQIGPDGSFRVGGLESGTARFSVENVSSTQGLAISRVERDGVPQPKGIRIQDGDHITGVKIVVGFTKGSIRGVVKVENGLLPSNAHLIFQLNKPGDQFGSVWSAEADARGHFLIEGLGTGNYELTVLAFLPGSSQRQPSAKQTVSVTDGGVTEITVTLDLTAIPN